jgi:hypothetical protein
MKLRVTDTPDRQHLGKEFDSEDRPIILSADFSMEVDKIIPLENGLRFVSSSYILDTVKV